MTESVLAYIPAYNEAARVGSVIRQTASYARQVVVIDDGSTDATASVAEEAGAVVLRHSTNQGKGAAIQTALAHFAGSDAAYAVFLDADGQHDPAAIPAMVAAAEAGADIVVGMREYQPGQMPMVRRWTNRFTSWLTSRLAGQRIPDSQCGFRLLRRTVLPHLHLRSRRFETETEMLIQAGRAGLRIVSVPIRTIYLPGRHSRIRPLCDTWRFLKMVVRYCR